MVGASTGEGDGGCAAAAAASASGSASAGAAGGEDVVIEYWAGNPSVEIAHGHICASSGPAARAALGDWALSLAEQGDSSGNGHLGTWASTLGTAAAGPPPPLCAGGCVVLASTVPCYMSAPELCDFVGAFAHDTHRHFRHCRVLHGRSPEEYLIALWLTTPEAAAGLIERFDGVPYNAIEAGVCRLLRVAGCVPKAPAEKDAQRAASPNTLALRRALSGGSSAPASSPGSGRLRSPVPHRAFHPAGLHGCVSNGGAPSPAGRPSPSPLARTGSPPLGGVPAFSLEASALVPAEEELFHSSSLLGTSEKAFCAVCLEHIEASPGSYQLTDLGGGVPLTILCGHTFHARCLSRWCDAHCPVCRFQQHPYQTSCCDVCGQTEGIHICLVCSFIGCTIEEGEGHAHQHYEATSHTYALEVSTQRVWDYAGNGYVHRVLYNQQDGKMVEHTVPTSPPGDLAFHDGLLGASGDDAVASSAAADAPAAEGSAPDEAAAECEPSAAAAAGADLALSGLARGGDARGRARPGAKKQEAVVAEFNTLLRQQMTAQGRYFEGRHKEQERTHAHERRELEAAFGQAEAAADAAEQRLAAALEANRALEREIAKAVADEERMRRQRQQLEVLNKKISSEQQHFEVEAEQSRELRRAQHRSRTQEVEELQQQIRDLELYMQMQKKLEATTDKADLQGAHLLVMETDQAGRGRGGRRPKRR